jgi:membrane protease YdiL (CAAX protease family)
MWITAVILTLIALLENSLLPWAPFYVVYALLALALPIWLGSYRFGSIRAVRWWHWPAGIAAAFLFQLVGAIIFVGLVPLLFGDVLGNPFYDIGAALPAMWEAAAARLNNSPAAIQSAYLLFIFLWAGVGEELFCRGYVQGALRPLRGFRAARCGLKASRARGQPSISPFKPRRGQPCAALTSIKFNPARAASVC